MLLIGIGLHGNSANGVNYVCDVYSEGGVGNSGYNSTRRAVRPVITIPKSDIVKKVLGIN